MSYQTANVIQLDDSFTFRCYICNKLINPAEGKSRDHIIPKTLFHVENTNRPTIDVHVSCNNNDKSRDDRWFGKSTLYRCMLNPTAREKFMSFMKSAERSLTDHPEKTPNDASSEKLMKTVLDGTYTAGVIEDETREKTYISTLARGLIIRNSWFIKCEIVEVFSVLRPLLTKQQNKKLNNEIKKRFLDQLDNCIYQFWSNDIRYVINPKENLVYLEFYGQQVYLVGFNYELPTITNAKKHVTHKQLESTQMDIDALNILWQREVSEDIDL